MVQQKIKTLLTKIFLENWQRKAISLLLAIIIWFLVNQSLSSSKTVGNIPVRVINIQPGKTITDLQTSGLLNKRVTLTLIGNRILLDELSPSDLEVVIDAQGKEGEWIATITKRNLISLNPEIDLAKGISRVSNSSVIVRLSKLTTEKIPVFITQPMGESPKDYQFLDVWPSQLELTVSGPEEVVRRLKTKGVRLTFDLHEISKADLDAIQTKKDSLKGDEVGYYIPDAWKKVTIPQISDTPIEIDDPKAKDLRIDFVRVSLLKLHQPIPISLYFPVEILTSVNPQGIALASTDLIKKEAGTEVLSVPLYAKGVSQLFVSVVQNMIQMMIVVDPTSEKRFLDWSVQFINPRVLENRYVSLMMSDVNSEEFRDIQSNFREEYLRNRFRSYMNQFQLFKSDGHKLHLNITLENNKVEIRESGGTASMTFPGQKKEKKLCE